MKQANLLIDTVLDWTDGEEPRVERVIWIDRAGDACALIRLNSNKAKPHDAHTSRGEGVGIRLNGKALPYLTRASELKEAISSGDARIIDDPVKRPLLREHEIPEGHKKKRDDAWEVIAPMVEGRDAWRMFDPKKRGPIVARREKELRELNPEDKKKWRTKKIIYGYLRRYWQGGQTKNALLPFYEKSGAKGVERHKKAGGYQKLGRKCDRTVADPERGDIGVNIDARSRRYILLGAKMFYERRIPKPTYKEAHEETLKKFFRQRFGQQGDPWAPVPPDADKAPTLDQFKYHYLLNRKRRRAIKAREGEHAYNTKYRERPGDSTISSEGPGSVFQIDATIADVYLCSSLDPSWIIGRPILYFVIDVFSRLIVGLSVGLKGPSWEGACLALLTTVADKVALCRQYGLHITEDEWPSSHLCDTLLADRGEFMGFNADNLVNNLRVEVQNAPTRRPDLKGIVENQFNLVNGRVNKWVPGHVRRRASGEKRCELDAALHVHEFRALMLSYAIEHNNERRLDDYPMSREMIAAKVPPYPVDIWRWGVEHLRGAPRARDKNIDKIRVALLPEGVATATRRGIKFRDAVYMCDYLREKEWLLRDDSSEFTVSYDPRFREPIYLRLEGGTRIETCYLIDRDKRFADCDIHETDDYFADKDNASDDSRNRELQARAKHSAFRNKIMKGAKERKDLAVAGLSDSERLSNKREKRRAEVEHLDRTEGRPPDGRPASEGSGEVINFPRGGRPQQADDDAATAPAKYTNLFRELSDGGDDDE